MSTLIILKNSNVTGRSPSNLAYGEVALNYADGKLFYKNSANQIDYFEAHPDAGTVKSVSFDAGGTGFSVTGGPITETGTFTLGGTLNIFNGGTGATNPTDALNNLLPGQENKSGRVLTTNGSVVFWEETFNGDYESLTNKPVLSSVAYTGLLGDLGNVDLSTNSPENGQVLGYDSVLNIWKPITLPPSVSMLSELTDVDNTAKTSGSVLVYDEQNEKWTATNTLNSVILDGGVYNQTP